MKEKLIVILVFLHTLLVPSLSFLSPSTTRERFVQISTITKSKKCFEIQTTQRVGKRSTFDHLSTLLQAGNEENNDEVKLGSKDYYSGFVSRGLNDESEERVTGDAILLPTVKFVGGFTLIIGTLLLGFLASNGLLF